MEEMMKKNENDRHYENPEETDDHSNDTSTNLTDSSQQINNTSGFVNSLKNFFTAERKKKYKPGEIIQESLKKYHIDAAQIELTLDQTSKSENNSAQAATSILGTDNFQNMVDRQIQEIDYLIHELRGTGPAK